MRSGGCGLGSRQQIAVTDVNDSLAHFSRVDSVLAGSDIRGNGDVRQKSIKVVLNL